MGGAWLALLFLAVGLLSQTLYNRAHNEQMYVAAGYLLAQGQRLYQDFAFVQMPYTPWVYAGVNLLTGGGSYLLKAKLVNYAWMVLAAGLLGARVRQIAGTGLAALLLVAFLANYYLLKATVEASNYTMPLALGLLAYGLLLRGLERRGATWLLCLGAGLALGGAIGAKLYYAALAVPFGLVALGLPLGIGWRLRFMRQLLPLALGTLVGLLPVLGYALRDWDRFAFNNLGYHLTNTLWRAQHGFTDMAWGAKWETARDLMTNPNLAPLLLWLVLAGLLWWNGRADHTFRPRAGTWLAGLCTLAAMLAAFSPQPLFSQYFAMPLPFLLLWIAEVAAPLPPEQARLLRGFGVAVALVAVLAVLPRHTGSLAQLLRGEPTAGQEAVATGAAIRAAIETRGADGDGPAYVATLSPVMALEGGLPFYPEFATGSFVYRIGDLLTPEERARYIATSPTTLVAQLDAQPPAAIYIGGEGELEIPLRDYAEGHGYTLVHDDLAGGQLYVR